MDHKNVHESITMRANCSTLGTLTSSMNLVDGATTVGSCTLTSTGVYTFVFTKTFKETPVVTIGLHTAAMRYDVATLSTTGCVVSTFGYADTTPTACAFSITVQGRCKV